MRCARLVNLLVRMGSGEQKWTVDARTSPHLALLERDAGMRRAGTAVLSPAVSDPERVPGASSPERGSAYAFKWLLFSDQNSRSKRIQDATPGGERFGGIR